MELDKNEDLLGFKVTLLPVDQIVGSLLESDNAVVNCLNAHSYVVQKSNDLFRGALLNSKFLLPDGSGIVLALGLVSKIRVKKIAGYDLFIETMSQLDKGSGTVFMLGSSDGVLDKIVDRARIDFPGVKVSVFSPPYKSQFNSTDIDDFVSHIEAGQPDVVFVGLTAPKQEILIDGLPQLKNVKFLAGIGAVFDFYAEEISRPHDFWINLHLEWAIRFFSNPKHLWRRVLVSQPIFIYDIICNELRRKR